MNTTRRMQYCLAGFWIACLGMLLVAPGYAQAMPQQDAQKQKAQEQPSEQEAQLRVFAVKFAHADGVAVLAQELFKSLDLTIAVDMRSNSLLVRASDPKVFGTIEELLTALDKPAETDKSQIKVFSLQNRHEPKLLRELLDAAIAGTETTLSIDSFRNLVVAKGDPESLAAIEAVLMRLDTREVELPDRQITFRLVWLVSGIETRGASPPEDLKEVVEELAAVGLSDLKLAAQTAVSAVSTSGEATRFSAGGRATLNMPTQLDIEGQLVGRKGNDFVLQVSIRATQEVSLPEGKTHHHELSQLHSTVIAPPGHAVVLGATPMESMNSVFVIQILPNE